MGDYADDAYEREIGEYFYECDHPEEFDGEPSLIRGGNSKPEEHEYKQIIRETEKACDGLPF